MELGGARWELGGSVGARWSSAEVNQKGRGSVLVGNGGFEQIWGIECVFIRDRVILGFLKLEIVHCHQILAIARVFPRKWGSSKVRTENEHVRMFQCISSVKKFVGSTGGGGWIYPFGKFSKQSVFQIAVLPTCFFWCRPVGS